MDCGRKRRIIHPGEVVATRRRKRYVRIEHEPDGRDCPGCRFWNELGGHWFCDYLGQTGQLRRCEPGKLCRVSERKKEEKFKELMNEDSYKTESEVLV